MPDTTLCFEDYCLLMVWMDAHWTRDHEEEKEAGAFNPFKLFKHAGQDFALACKREMDGVKKQIRDKIKNQIKNQVKDLRHSGLDADLGRAVCCLALGRPDTLGMTLLDDMDTAQAIMAETGRTIEESTIAFCLKPQPFTRKHPGLRKHLVTVKELLGELYDSNPKGKVRKTNSPPERPLVMMARLKLEGLPLLLDPVQLQGLILREIVRRMALVWSEIKSGRDASGLFAAEDRQESSWRVAFLDLQEEEEIGLLFTCRNPSLPSTMLSSVRGITFGKLQEQFGDEITGIWDHSEGEKLLRGCTELKQHVQGDAGKNPQLEKVKRDSFGRPPEYSHVFRWTRTSVALHLNSFLKLEKKGSAPLGITGRAATLTQVQVPPGHSLEAAKLADAAREKVDNKRAEGPSSGPEASAHGRSWRACMVGSVDMLSGTITGEKCDEGAWLTDICYQPVERVFTGLAYLCRAMMEKEKDPQPATEGTGHASSGSDLEPTRQVSGWATTLIIPVPRQLSSSKREDLMSDFDVVPTAHCPHLLQAVSGAVGCLFPMPRPESRGANGIGSYLRRLRQDMALSGMPATLRRAFMVLFEKYRSLAKHPMRFDTVLDLFDAMKTLHETLSKHLPRALSPKAGMPLKGFISVPRLARDSVRFLYEFASAVESSLDIRLRRIFPESPRQEWDLDFRGPMSQVVIAGETVLRSALGIVRRNVLGDGNHFNRLGVANRMTVAASITHDLGGLGIEKDARLSFVDTDVAHLTHLAQLADYFHEAFHIIHQEMLLSADRQSRPTINNSSRKVERKQPPSNVARNVRGRLAQLSTDGVLRSDFELTTERTAESFVAMLMFLIVADGDEDLIWAQQGTTYATDPKSAPSPVLLDPEADAHLRAAHLRELHRRYAATFIPVGILSAVLESLRIQDQALTGHAARDVRESCLRLHRKGLRLDPMPVSAAREIFIRRCQQMARLMPVDFPVQPQSDHQAAPGLHQNPWAECVLQEFDKAWLGLAPKAVDIMWDVAMEVASCFMADVTGETRLNKRLLAAWKMKTKKTDALIKPWGEAEGPGCCSPISVKDIFRQTTSDDPAPTTLFIIRALRWVWSTYLPKPHQTDPQVEWRLPRRLFLSKSDQTSTDAKHTKMRVKIDWGGGKVTYADYLLDPIRPEGFCVDPAKRARRLRHQALFMKSIWGITAVLRRRRLFAMMAEAKKVQPQENEIPEGT